MRVLGFPPVVIPTHADNFRVPYGSPLAYRTEWVEAFAEEVRVASPDSRLIIPQHLELHPPVGTVTRRNGGRVIESRS